MLSNSKIKYYVLVPLLILIWGTIAYKILEHIKGGTVEFNEPIQFDNYDKKESAGTFKLLENYANPFIKKNKSNSSAQSEYKQNRQGSNDYDYPQEVQNNIEFYDNIQYGGWVQIGAKNKVGMLKYNNNNILVKEMEKYDGFKVEKLFKDSVCIIFDDGRRMTIIK